MKGIIEDLRKEMLAEDAGVQLNYDSESDQPMNGVSENVAPNFKDFPAFLIQRFRRSPQSSSRTHSSNDVQYRRSNSPLGIEACFCTGDDTRQDEHCICYPGPHGKKFNVCLTFIGVPYCAPIFG
ncbi:unnamed protein product [Notodromas monacha]|uniref:Uncharacterized protein n=1 Tax=Notodromas monacha TaxID=399045 RepID=A0A7R9C2T1_9CRUS|nr:unnamed protein product [Notodromas monacha]CAG0925090.1 unnamed protein product [Notodromas monacha]